MFFGQTGDECALPCPGKPHHQNSNAISTHVSHTEFEVKAIAYLADAGSGKGSIDELEISESSSSECGAFSIAS